MQTGPNRVTVFLTTSHTGASQDLDLRRAQRFSWARLCNLWGALLGESRARVRRRERGRVGAPMLPRGLAS